MEFEEQQELDTTATKTSMPQDSHLDHKGGPLILQVPCGVMLHQDVHTIKPVHAILDTGSRQSIMTYQGAKKAGLFKLVDTTTTTGTTTTTSATRHATTSVSSSSSSSSCQAVLGYIAPNIVDLRMGSEEATMSGPRIVVLQQPSAEASTSTSTQTVDLILGMDFLQQHQGIIDLRQQELHLINAQGEDVMVPFLQPRATLPLSFDESEAQEEVTKDDGCRNTNTCGSSD
jgi:hypothetical protein